MTGMGAAVRPAADFLLDPAIVHLNHGGFGACPRPVLAAQQRWQQELERHPSALLSFGYDDLLGEVRAALAEFVGCRTGDLVLVPNTTAGLNAAAHSLSLRPGEEVLATDHEYEAMNVLWSRVCEAAGARYVRQPLPLPVGPDPAQVVDALFAAVTPATRVIFTSHITSMTAIPMPVAQICRRARELGILTIIDGAHAVGHLPLDLPALGADIYVASCHKWLCAPRGTGFLHARPEHQAWLRAPMLSHGSGPEADFQTRFRWQGTGDPSPALALPEAIAFHRRPEVADARQHSHALAQHARARGAELFGLAPFTAELAPGLQMQSLPIPHCDDQRMRRRLLDDYRIDAPVRTWKDRSLVRVSIQAYNTERDVELLMHALADLFGTHRRTTP